MGEFVQNTESAFKLIYNIHDQQVTRHKRIFYYIFNRFSQTEIPNECLVQLKKHLHESLENSFQGFLDSAEYETMLAEIQRSVSLDSDPYNRPKHVSIHQCSQFDSDPCETIIGVCRAHYGKLDVCYQTTPISEELQEALPHFLLLPKANRSASSLHSFALSVKGRLSLLYGSSLVCSQRVVEHSDEGDAVLQGAFVVSTMPYVDKARKYILKAKNILESSIDIPLKVLLDQVNESLGPEHLTTGPFPKQMRDIDFTIILSVDPNVFVRTMLACLTEHQIVIISSHASKLVAFTESLFMCLWPLQWCHLYFPYLPLTYANMLQSPVPYLVGVLQDEFNTLLKSNAAPRDALILNIDEDVIFANNIIEENLYGQTTGDFIRKLRENISSSLKYHDDYGCSIDANANKEMLTAQLWVSTCQQFVSRFLSIMRFFGLKMNLITNVPEENSIDVDNHGDGLLLSTPTEGDGGVVLVDEKLCRLFFMKSSNQNKRGFIVYDKGFVKEMFRTQSLSNYITAFYK